MSRSAHFWAITQRVVGQTSCPETSVGSYHYTLRNRPEEHSSHLLRGESLEPQLSAAESLLGSRRQSAGWQDIPVPIGTKQEVNFRRIGTGISVKRGCIVTYKFSCVQNHFQICDLCFGVGLPYYFTRLGNAATERRHTFGHVTSAGWLCSKQVMHTLHGDFSYNLDDDYSNQFFTIADRRQILTSLPLFEHDAQSRLEINAHNNILLPLICLKINHHFRGSFHWAKHESTCSNNSVILWSTVLFQGSASHQATKSGSRICKENKDASDNLTRHSAKDYSNAWMNNYSADFSG